VTKVLGTALAILVVLLGLPFAAALVVTMGVDAATECSTDVLAADPPPTLPVDGLVDAPVGGSVTGDIVVAQANIPDRVGMAGFSASMPRVLSSRPDFVSLNEMAGRSLAQIEAAAPGYAAYREPVPVPGPSARESVSNVVAWRSDTWTRVAGGRVTLVEDDRGFYDGHPIVWDRFVTWTILQRTDGAVVSMLSTHHMINPYKYPRQHGDPPLTRAEQYGQGMDTLIGLAAALAAHGPVLIAGDMNTHPTYTDLPWSAVAKMSAAGYGWHAAGIDFIFYQRRLGVTLTNGWSGAMQSDHPWVAARLSMNGVGATRGTPTPPADPEDPTAPIPEETHYGTDSTLPVASTASTPTGECTPATTTSACTTGTTGTTGYDLGPVRPELARLVAILAPMFGIETVGGYRESVHDPQGHPSGLAADFMVPPTPAGRQQGDRLAEYARAYAGELGIDYIIWYQHIWSTERAGEGWRPMPDRGGDTENHRDHVHINVLPAASPVPISAIAPGCSGVVYPVPEEYVAADQHNWHASGPSWSSWHTGTDFALPCGTPVYAAHGGTVEIDTTQPWAGPYLVRVTTSPTALATWYAHMRSVTVSRAQTVTAGDQLGTAGDLGNARACHLHFEVHLRNGSIYGADNVNPSDWLALHAGRVMTAHARRHDVGDPEEPDHAA
jgi:hypothetical protein